MTSSSSTRALSDDPQLLELVARVASVAALLVKLDRLHNRSGVESIYSDLEVCLARGGGGAFGGGLLRQARDVGDGRLMLALSLIAGLFHLAQPRGEAGAFLSLLAIEMRLAVGELPCSRRQGDVVPLLRILQGSVRAGELERERRFALDQPGNFGSRQLMLAPSLIAGLFHLAQLRGEASAFRLGLSPLAIEMRLTVGELAAAVASATSCRCCASCRAACAPVELERERRFALESAGATSATAD